MSSTEYGHCIAMETEKSDPFNGNAFRHFVALEVESRKFLVPTNILANYSPVFEKLLLGDFAETKMDTISLPGKKADDVKEFLACLIPGPEMKSIDLSNVATILKFAQEYQIEDLRRRADTFLKMVVHGCETGEQRLLQILRMGSEFRLKESLQECTKRCGTEFKLEELQAHFRNLRSEVVASILLYSSVSLDLKCQYAYQVKVRPLECSNHHCVKRLTCVYCSVERCGACLNDGEFENATCNMARSDCSVEGTVNELLSRI